MPNPSNAIGAAPRSPAAALTALAALAFAAAAAIAGADGAPLPMPPAEPPEALAVRGTAAPTLDGDVLADPAWAAVKALTGFWQIAPDAGAPASQPTEVRILFTDDTLYFGIVCRDAEPGGIVVNESRRDSELIETDSFQIILDTCRPRVRRPGHERGRGRRRDAGPGLIARRLQQELGRLLDGAHAHGRLRLERGVRDPVQDAALRPRQGARLGPELPAQHQATSAASSSGASRRAWRSTPPSTPTSRRWRWTSSR